MKKLLEENKTLTQVVNDAGQTPTHLHQPDRTFSQIYKWKFSSKNPAKMFWGPRGDRVIMGFASNRTVLI